ncbi:MAG TPA: SGNH/GDSL hydrolase family protein [Pyrinomonadaceae bacterium]|nr:SGNH/GDSL hydrolase family protein [Pyrinomonadaceae bacterium]
MTRRKKGRHGDKRTKDDDAARAAAGDDVPPAAEDPSAAPAVSDPREASSAQPSAAPPLSRRRRLLFLSVPYVLFLALLLACEGVVRLTLPRVSPLEALVDSPHQRQGFTDRQRVSVFEGDPLLFWRLKPNVKNVVWDFTHVSTNAQGLRHEGDLGPKPAGAIRVVCLGDSVTFGYRVPVVWPERPDEYARDWLPYPALLERALRAANPGRQIEVVALAVPGYTSHQGLLWLRRDIERLDPDLVTVCFGWNDIVLRPRPDSQTMSDGFLSVNFRRLMSVSQLVTHAALRMQRGDADAGKPAPAPQTPRVPRDEYVRNILEMARLARERGAPAVVIAPVYRDAAHDPAESARISGHRDALRRAAGEAGLPFVEILELTEAGHPANSALFGEAIHPNHLGHRLMADALLKLFSEQKLLKNLYVPPGL